MKMNNQQNSVCIESIVLKYFIRELKGRKLYHVFFREIPKASTLYYAVKRLLEPNGNCNKMITSNRNSNHESTPFRNSKTIQNIVEVLIKLNSNISRHYGMGSSHNQDENSERVTMTINHLIHFFLEQNGGNMDLFNSVGQSVFNNTCNYLWGVEYTEEQNRIESEQRQKLSTPEGLRGVLWTEYVRECANGFRGSFEEFMAIYNNIAENIKNNGAQNDPYMAISLIPSVLNGDVGENIEENTVDDYDIVDDDDDDIWVDDDVELNEI